MKATSYAILALTAITVLLITLLSAAYSPKAERRARFTAILQEDFEASRGRLEQFVEQTDVSGHMDLSLIQDTRLGRRVLRAKRDSNGNIYFVLRDSWVTFNVGVVRRRGSATLLGDGEEPRLNYVEKIAEGWFLYHAS